MIFQLSVFISIFLLGEIILNLTFFKYLKNYFEIGSNQTQAPKFLGLNISIFKGILERLLIFYSLTIDLPHILILFGAIKIGTRFEKNDKIQNDYFLIGNLSSVLFAITYHFIYQTVLAY